MGNHLDFREAVVDFRLEDLYAPPGDLRARETADQLFGLSGEHRAADHFEGTGSGWVHLLIFLFFFSTPTLGHRSASVQRSHCGRRDVQMRRPCWMSAWLIQVQRPFGMIRFRSR